MADAVLRPLVPAEEAWLVAELTDGRRPTVHVLAASGDLPAGARARVLAAEAARAGEYLIVEVKGDRLPFAAPELALPPTVAKRVRRAAGVVDPPPKPARRTTKTAGSRPTPKPVLAKSAPAKSAPAKAAPVKAAAAKSAPAKAVPAKAVPGKAASGKAAPDNAVPGKAAAPAAGRAPGTRAKPARRRPGSPVSVTITFDGQARWTVEARTGSRRVRPVEIPAGAAAAASEALGVPEVDALVSAITDAMRRDAEDRTDALRAQLAAAEAELARLSRS
ncbi:MAG: hypothetical protein QOK14_12 [Frankiaceae bacterium]|nr:hypothetical protein [Frankiaceae bacterium]